MAKKWLPIKLIISGLVLAIAPAALAATLKITPPAGVFTVGDTFEVEVIVDTAGEAINAVSATIQYPPDKLQIVSSGVGRSVLELWVKAPRFDNQAGLAEFQGLIPGGLNSRSGVISTLTFRVKATGKASISFCCDLKVLLNDGKGSAALTSTANGIYSLILPPPAGPAVSSPTHPDQDVWYSSRNVTLVWGEDNGGGVSGYSYILSRDPLDVPDDISNGARTQVAYSDLADGLHYFHIKSLRNGVWGGTSHFAFQIDASPPARFPVEILPSKRTSSEHPVIQFATSDALSGINRYELNIVPLDLTLAAGESVGQPFFFEATSPYVTSLGLGRYDIIVRAYDNAGNYREEVARLTISQPLLRLFTTDGLLLRGDLIIAWFWLWGGIGALLLGLIVFAWSLRRWHRRLKERLVSTTPPIETQKQLEELKIYRDRYGKLHLFIIGAVLAGLFLAGSPVWAQGPTEFGPPIITTVSRHLSNDEIFYVGGQTRSAGTEVLIYLQNVTTGEIQSGRTSSSERGEWFYNHNGFLSQGRYLLWVQGRSGEELSPPSAQHDLTVTTTAFELGASRLSYHLVYGTITIILFLLTLILGLYITWAIWFGRRHHRQVQKEITEAAESVRRGFAVLKRDIQAELAIVRRAKLNKELSAEEAVAEQKLLKDLAAVESYIGKEIWDIEELEK